MKQIVSLTNGVFFKNKGVLFREILSPLLLLLLYGSELNAATVIPYYNQTEKDITVYVGEKFQLGYSDRAYVGRHYTVDSESWSYDNATFTGEVSGYTYVFTANEECVKQITYKLSYHWTAYSSSYPKGRTQYGNVNVTWNVTVISRPAPEQILLNETMIDMPIGSSYQLVSSIQPTDAFQTVTWSSNAPEIASVNGNGLVTGTGLGDAVITVSSDIDNSVFATCNVHVGTTDVKTIDIPTDISMHYGNETQLTPEISPSYAVYNLKWQSSDENVAMVDQSGNIMAVGPGTATVTVIDQVTNVEAKCIVSVYMEVGDTFNVNIQNDETESVSGTFMLNDLENHYVSIGNSNVAAIPVKTSGSIVLPSTIVGPGNIVYHVNSIAANAFKGCAVSSVTIPQEIESIGDNAFNGCSSLTSVTVNWTEPISISSNCFSNAANATLYVPKSCYWVYKEADNWKFFSKIAEPPYVNGDLFVVSTTANTGLVTDITFMVIDASNKYVSVGNGEESSISDLTSGRVYIPSTVNGYDGQTYEVKQLSTAAFFGCYEVNSVGLPTSITSIGRAAFYDCSALASFTIPTNVMAIGEDAFSGCTKLTSIDLPASINTLGEGAFYGCNNLTSVTVNRPTPITIDADCFSNAAKATLNIPKGSYEKYAAAENWKSFKVIKEPAHAVGETFMATIKTAVDAQFMVTDISYYRPIVSIGNGEDAAIDIFTSGVIEIPSTVKGYDGKTYTVETVADAAFFGCENISSVSLPSDITEIGNSAFFRCYNLSRFSIPTKVNKIGDEAFFNCEKLTSISIPKNLTSLGEKAFSGCTKLVNVTVERNTPITIDAECFSNAANATLHVPYGSKERYEVAEGWKQFKNIVEMAPKDGDTFTALTVEGIKMTFTIISASAKTCRVGNYSIPNGTNGIVTIPSTANDFAVTRIGYWAFRDCSQITEIVIPTSVTSIDLYALAGCSSLATITIPNSVTTIDGTAFSGCSSLASVTVEWDEPIAISDGCFSNAANATLYVPMGTNHKYSAATGWKEFGQIVNWTKSALFAEDVIVCRGGQLTLPIMLTNDANVRMLQFELSLPEGVSVATDGLGNPLATLTQRANATHIITGSPLDNGNYQFQIMAKGISDDVIQGTEGRIATITLKVLRNVTPNDYDVRITDSELTIDGEAMPLLLSDASSKLTVSPIMLGDTNDDKRVSVTDISNIIDYILHKDVPGFYYHAANASGDERISVTDISTIIDIILHKTVFGEKQATRIEELDPQ